MRPDTLKREPETRRSSQTSDQHPGPNDNAKLRAIEDQCIRDAIALQQRGDLRLATDGEFRRRSWWLELVMNWKGVCADRTGTTDLTWRVRDGRKIPLIYD